MQKVNMHVIAPLLSGAMLFWGTIASSQDVSFPAPSNSMTMNEALPPRIFQYSDVSNFISNDAQKVNELENAWGTRALDPVELKALANGWLSSNEALSPKAETGIEILKGLADQQDAEALTSLGIWASSPSLKGQLGDPTDYFGNAARLGDPTALQLYGRILQSGSGTPEDWRRAITLFEDAVSKGNKEAAIDLAISSEFGLGTEQNAKDISDYYATALETGNPVTFVAYADYLVRQGFDPQGDDVKGLLLKAAELGDQKASLWVTRDRIMSGASSEEIRSISESLIAKGEAGDQSALLFLARNADVVSISGQSSVNKEKWLKQAARLGSVEAQGELGWHYIQQGRTGSDSLQAAGQLIEASARAGYPGAMVALAHPAVSPDASSVERYSMALSGYELSQGLEKQKFEEIKRIACSQDGNVRSCAPVPVFYFTNRAEDVREGGRVSYLNQRSKGPNGSSFGLAYAFPPAETVHSETNQTENWWNVLVASAKDALGITRFRKMVDEWYNEPEKAGGKFSVRAERSSLTENEFIKQIKKVADEGGKKKALIYVHGFSNSFDSSIERLAFISKQYNYPAVPIVFGWASANAPVVSVASVSRGDIGLGYVNDHRVVRASCGTFQQTLKSIINEFGDGNVMILAHSMGGELTMDMLTGCIGGSVWDSQKKLGSIIFAAPDIDRSEFEEKAPKIAKMASTTVMYTSTNDKALAVSRQFNVDGAPRAGEGGDRVLIVPPVQTVDASAVERLIGTDARNHSYVFDARQVRKDLVAVLRDVPLHQRDCITLPNGSRPQAAVAMGEGDYFVIQAACD